MDSIARQYSFIIYLFQQSMAFQYLDFRLAFIVITLITSLRFIERQWTLGFQVLKFCTSDINCLINI